MGRTQHNQKSFEDEDRKQKNSRGSKHSRNIPGQGMRVINKWYSEEDDDTFYDDVGISDEVSIVHTKAR
jgi:hypothetical protein